jgi:hypothetical protein
MVAVVKGVAPYLGAALVAVGLLDIYFTVLFARSGAGLVSPYLESWTWRTFRGVGRAVPRFRDKILSHAGPVILVLVALSWAAMLLLGFGLMYWPQVGGNLRLDGADAARPTLGTALAYSGYCLTSLGTPSTMTPQTPFLHWLSVLEAGCGFALFTVTLAYFLQVGNAVLRRNHVALKLHHSSQENPDAAEMVARLGAGGDFSDARTELATMAEDLLEFFESHHFYPAINYFRFAEADYDTARMAVLAMDAASLVRTTLDGEACGHLDRSEAVGELWTAGLHFLREMSQTLLPAAFRPPALAEPAPQEVTAWRQRYERALLRLEAEGIKVTRDRSKGADEYVRLRRQWDAYVKALARFVLREWAEVAPHERPAVPDSGE